MAESRSTIQLPAPTPIALVLCDNVYRDSRGKQALIGLFNKITAQKFPATHSKLCAYVAITSIRPDSQCRLEIVDASSDETVCALMGPAPPVPTPTAVLELVFELNMVTFQRPGRYYVRFLGNNQPLMERPFDVVQIRSQTEESQDASDS